MPPVDDQEPVAEERPPAPLLELSDGLPEVTDTPEALARVVDAFGSGTGPVAIDAERASGYRYSPRAYLIQLRREGAGTALIDPTVFADLKDLNEALGDAEWILHAATQDLPCLTELGLRPVRLFDTELAGRLLGYPRVGLATLVESIVGERMRKEHSAADWSTRPLPEAWLVYAALDVEVLIELRDALATQLFATNKAEWARQEFEHLVNAAPAAPRVDPWRRTSGLHRIRNRRSVAAVRNLWETRDAIASQRDVTPTHILPDTAIIAAATALPGDRRTLLTLKGFKGRGAERYARYWLEAVAAARTLDDAELPPLTGRYDGPPPPRSWADRDPLAAARLHAARGHLKELVGELNLPLENVLAPGHVRRVIWSPPPDGPDLTERVGARLRELGAREWQIELAAPVIADAIAHAQPEPPDAPPPDPEDPAG